MDFSSAVPLSEETRDLGIKYAIYYNWKKGEIKIRSFFMEIEDLGIKSIDDVEEYIKNNKIYGEFLETATETIKDTFKNKAMVCVKATSGTLVAIQISNEEDLAKILKDQIQYGYEDNIYTIEDKNRLEELTDSKEEIKNFFKEEKINIDVDRYI